MSKILKNIAKKTGLGPLYVKGYIEGTNYLLYKDLYNRSQYIMGGLELHKKNIDDFTNSFDELINSFVKKGFDKNYPITVSKELLSIDGHHRSSCCVYFNIEPTYIINNSYTFKNYNGLDWILNNPEFSNCYSVIEKVHIIEDFERYNNISILIVNKAKKNILLKKLKKYNINILGSLNIKFTSEIILLKKYFTEIDLIIIDYNKLSHTKFKKYYGNNIKEQQKIKDVLLKNKIIRKKIIVTNTNKLLIKYFHFKNKLKRIFFEGIIKILNLGKNTIT